MMRPASVCSPPKVDHVDVLLLQLRHERGIVLLARVDAFVHDLLEALAVHGLLGLVGEALAVGGLVVDDATFLPLNLSDR
jgi:hypothetical protein